MTVSGLVDAAYIAVPSSMRSAFCSAVAAVGMT